MARKSTGPKWYKSKKAFYATVGGKTHNLGADAEKAGAQWGELMKRSRGEAAGDAEPLAHLITKYLAYVKGRNRESTHVAYERKLKAFATTRPVSELRPHHVSEFIQGRSKWGSGSARMLVSALKSMMVWGVKQGYLSTNPLANLERIAGGIRGDECVVTKEQHDLLHSQVSPALADLLSFLWHTGTRPTAAMLIEARDVQGTQVVMQNRPGIKLKRVVIYLNKIAAKIVAGCVEENPSGPIFRSPHGLPWCKQSLYEALGRVKGACGCRHVTPYSYRHAYAHRALRAGLPIAHIAKVMNTSTAHIEKVYGHLHTAADVLQDLVERV